MWEKLIENVLSKETSVVTVMTCGGLYVFVNLPRIAKESAEAALKFIEVLKAWRGYKNDNKLNQ